jgi:hypothetical protein
MKSPTDLGDGDRCPLNPDHGRMYTLKGTTPPKQWCASSAHDGRPKSHPDGEAPPTRAYWPLGPVSFANAVAETQA